MARHFTLKTDHPALYPSHCSCEASFRGRTWSCRLIALYRGGARLGAPSFRAMALAAGEELLGQALSLNIRFLDKEAESGGFPAFIVSVSGDEFMAAFARPLRIGFSGPAAADSRLLPW